MTDLLSRVLPPKPTDAELVEGKKSRDSFRQQVQTFQTELRQSSSAFQELKLYSIQKELDNSVKKASAWLEANIEVTSRQVNTEQTRFQEEISSQVQSLESILPNAVKQLTNTQQSSIVSSVTLPQLKTPLQKAINDIQKRQTNEQIKAREDLQSRTITTDIKDGLGLFSKYFVILIFLLLALRVGAFAANATLHQATPFRILNFLYTALFFPFFVLYYGFFEVRHLLWPDVCPSPRIESMLPIYSYTPEKELTFADRLFGYPETPDLLSVIQTKTQELDARQLEVLQISSLADIMKEKA